MSSRPVPAILNGNFFRVVKELGNGNVVAQCVPCETELQSGSARGTKRDSSGGLKKGSFTATTNFLKHLSDDTPLDEDDEDAELQLGDNGLYLSEGAICLPRHIRCGSHNLSLVATEDFIKPSKKKPNASQTSDPAVKKIFSSAMSKCTALWNKISRSNQVAEEIYGVIGKHLKTPCPTRWNSLFDCSQQLLQHTERFEELFEKAGVPNLLQDEVEFLRHYVTCMEPIAIALDKLQGENGFFFGYFAPILLATKSKLEDIIKYGGARKHVKTMADCLKARLEKRFKNVFCMDFGSSSFELLSAVSLPYFKLSLQSFSRMVNSKLETEFVISGISGRFPKASNVVDFWNSLQQKQDGITADQVPFRSGKLDEVNKFDADFFDIGTEEAESLDIRLRFMLELVHEAVVDAGVSPTVFRGTNTGVFLGASGECISSLSGRISSAFGLKGPSQTAENGSQDSSVALFNALQALRSRSIEAAIVSGVQINPTTCPQSQVSPDGKCKSFDANANGIVPAEAAVVIYITSKDSAKRNYATLVNAGSNASDSKTPAEQFLIQLYADSKVSPGDVAYVESNSTGIKSDDQEEANALATVLSVGREGSPIIELVKSNVGHAGPAA
ncbi:unnamed protein product, partial [Allacma fusca]